MRTKPTPAIPSPRTAWINQHIWLEGCELEVEYMEAREEGRDLSTVESEFKRLLAVPTGPTGGRLSGQRDEAWLEEAGRLMDQVQTLPWAQTPYCEPPGLSCIRQTLGRAPRLPAWKGSKAKFQEKLHGGLLGRICGCMLGKPVECWRRADIRAIAESTGNWPLADYFSQPTPAQQKKLKAVGRKEKFGWDGCLRGSMKLAYSDDDLNYTATGFAILKQYGKDFTPNDVAAFWCNNIPILNTCTAERVAYRNFVKLIVPPESASHRNPYREWIGAQIRADYFGYANPGNPARAAEWAWRDACISHIGNGIYGEMWVAAMLAAAYVESDYVKIIRAGLAQIPPKSRLHEDIEKILAARVAGKTFDEVVELVHTQWDEKISHHWCHANSNAQLVAAALLYGEDDFEKTITRAVSPGFDTDCNGATAGSIWGVIHGVRALPRKWTATLHDTLRTGVSGYNEIKISALAKEMAYVAIANF